MPPKNPEYDLTVFVHWIFPAFRLCSVICFFSWMLALCIKYWETYSVNYKFILDADPNCTLDANDFVGLASLQTIVWSAGMILQLADYKFAVFNLGEFWSAHMYAQLFAQFFVIPLLPASEWNYEYRLSILLGLWNCIKAIPMAPSKATFWDNLTGDMLTSLVKPMNDLYLCNAMILSGLVSESLNGDTVWILPFQKTAGIIIAITPTWIRIQQQREKLIHAREVGNKAGMQGSKMNIGKFSCGICVVIVTNLTLDRWLSPYTTRLSWVVSYIIASLYALYWDMVKDWGLAANPDTFLREGEKIMFPQWIYGWVAMMDVFGRLTWALTLMPEKVLGKSIIQQQSVVTVTSLIEVVRRFAWFLVKIEHEHLSNSAKHRALLWVPKPNQNNDSIGELHKQVTKHTENKLQMTPSTQMSGMGSFDYEPYHKHDGETHNAYEGI